jgi:hypothetical protein
VSVTRPSLETSAPSSTDGPDHLAGLGFSQRAEVELREGRVGPPGGPVVGPVAEHQHDAGVLHPREGHLEQGEGRFIDPLQIFDDHDHRLPLAQDEHHARDGLEGPPLDLVRGKVAQTLHGNAQQAAEIGGDLVRLLVVLAKLAADLLAGHLDRLSALQLEVLPEHLRPGPVGEHAAQRGAARLEHLRLLARDLLLELVEEPRLAAPGLPDDGNHLR